MKTESRPHERNRLLGALLPSDFALLAPDLKDMHFEQGVVLQEAGGLSRSIFLTVG
jgi:hypothetical protein